MEYSVGFVRDLVNDAYQRNSSPRRVKRVIACNMSYSALLASMVSEGTKCYFGRIIMSVDMAFSQPPTSTRQIAFASFLGSPRTMLMARIGLAAGHLPVVNEDILFDDIRWGRSNTIAPTSPTYTLANLQAAYWASLMASDSQSITAEPSVVCPYFTFTGYRVEMY